MGRKSGGCKGCGSSGPKPQRVDKKPIVKPDGSLLFKSVAPTYPGYVHDVNNPKRLIPDSLPCMKRMTLPVLQRDGKYVIMNNCNHQDCDMRGQAVNAEICGSCPLRVRPPKTVVAKRQETENDGNSRQVPLVNIQGLDKPAKFSGESE